MWLWKLFTQLHVWLYRVTGGRIGAAMGQGRILLLTTTGRKSGKTRTTPLGYFELKGDGSYLVVASAGGADKHPAWFFNLQSYPEVAIQVKGKRMKARAVVVSSEERPALWAKLVEVAPPYGEYSIKTNREIPLVLLYPE